MTRTTSRGRAGALALVLLALAGTGARADRAGEAQRPPEDADLVRRGAVFASAQGGVRIEAPVLAGTAPTYLVLETGEAIEVATSVRFSHASKGGRTIDLGSRRALGDLDGAAGVRWPDALPGADLVHESRPGALKTALVVREAPRGLAPGSAGAVFFEEEIVLPAGFRVEGLAAAAAAGRLPGLETGLPEEGFARIDQHLHLIDAAGTLRATIEAPRVFEGGRPAGSSGREAPAFAEVRFDPATGRLVYRTAAPAAWLADPTRRFPVIFDPVLSANAPLAISGDNTYTIAPQAGRWNVVAVSGAGTDYDLAVVGAASTRSGSDCDYLVADGHLGAITPVSVSVDRFSLSGTGTLQHATPGTVRLGIDAGFPWSAAQVVALFEVDVPVAGMYDLAVDGVAGLRWWVYSPGGSSKWAARGFSVAGHAAGPSAQTFAFGGGPHALVIWKDGGPGPSGNVTVRWPGTPTLALALDAPQAAGAAGAALFALAPRAGAWNAVGAFGDDWDLTIGGAASSRAGATTDFCVADGRRGAITPSSGSAVQVGGFSPAVLEHSAQPAALPALVPGTAATRPFAAGDALRLFEVEVAAAGSTWLTVGGVTGVSCALFPPGTSAAWAGRAAAAREIAASTPAQVVFAQPGVFALVVFRDAPGAPAGSTLSFDWTAPGPVPALLGISPSSVTQQAVPLTLTLDGTGFVPGSIVRVGGADRPTTFRSPTRLEATLPAADVASPGTLSVSVFTPPPGGGTSGALALAVTAAPSTGGGTGTGSGTGSGGTGTGGGSTGGTSTGGTAPAGPAIAKGGSGGGGGCAIGANADPGSAAGALLPWAALVLLSRAKGSIPRRSRDPVLPNRGV